MGHETAPQLMNHVGRLLSCLRELVAARSKPERDGLEVHGLLNRATSRDRQRTQTLTDIGRFVDLLLA